MYAPRHRHFATGLVVHGEVQHFAQVRQQTAKATEQISLLNSMCPKFKVRDVRMRSKK